MSYTYYWECKAPITDDKQFARWSHDVQTLLRYYPYFPNHWYWEGLTSNTPPDNWTKQNICGPFGVGLPMLTDEEVAFNGDINASNASEAFIVTFKSLQEIPEINGCTTNCKPYDLLVAASLIRLKHYFPEILILCDGGARGFQQGAQFCREVFGIGINPDWTLPLDIHQPINPGMAYYPSLEYLHYMMTWYKHLHTLDAIRFATFTQKAPLESSDSFQQTFYFEIINDSKRIVWDVLTGGSFQPLKEENGYLLMKSGSDFPSSDTLYKKSMVLDEYSLPYRLGMVHSDQFLNDQAPTDHNNTIYFHDGTVMLVKIPSECLGLHGISRAVKGIITYSIVQTARIQERNSWVISQDEYRQQYDTA